MDDDTADGSSCTASESVRGRIPCAPAWGRAVSVSFVLAVSRPMHLALFAVPTREPARHRRPAVRRHCARLHRGISPLRIVPGLSPFTSFDADSFRASCAPAYCRRGFSPTGGGNSRRHYSTHLPMWSVHTCTMIRNKFDCACLYCASRPALGRAHIGERLCHHGSARGRVTRAWRLSSLSQERSQCAGVEAAAAGREKQQGI